MKTCGGVEVQTHDFLKSKRVEREWSASRPSRYISGGKTFRYPLDKRLRGPHSQSGKYGENESIDPTGARTLTPR
jgi:hypothetical protein